MSLRKIETDPEANADWNEGQKTMAKARLDKLRTRPETERVVAAARFRKNTGKQVATELLEVAA